MDCIKKCFLSSYILVSILLCWSKFSHSTPTIQNKIHQITLQHLTEKYQVSLIKINILTPNKALEEVCEQPMLFFSNGLNKLTQQHTITAKCHDKNHYIRMTIAVRVYFWTAAKPLSAHHVINADDLTKSEGLLNTLPNDIILNKNEIIGMIPIKQIAVGQIFTARSIKNNMIIIRGKEINVNIDGCGFTIRARAKAVRSAALGEAFLIRMQNGKLLTAIATSADTATVSLNI